MAVATPAGAAPKVALPAIEGDDTGSMRDAVAAALDGDQLTVLGERETNRAVDGLRNENLAEMTEKQAKKLSTDLEADAVVTAVLGKKGKAKTLKFRLFVGGKKTKGFTVQFKNARSTKFKTALHDKMVDRISGNDVKAAPPPEEDEPVAKKRKVIKSDPVEEEEDPNPKPKREPKEVAKTDDEDAPKKKDKKKDKKTASRDSDEDEDEPAIVKRMAPAHSANRVAARLDAGVSVGNRSLVFTQRNNFPEGPKAFRSKPVPGARVEGEIYPLAFLNPNSIAAGLGVAFDFDKTLVLKLGTSAEPGKTIKVNQTSFTVGGRFRFAFGNKPTSPTVTAGVDYGKRTWKADRAGLMDTTPYGGLTSLDLPDTDYSFVAPGLGFRIPFGQMIAFTAYGKALFVSKAGAIQSSQSYGKAKIFGFDATAGFDIVISNRFGIRIAGELTQFGYTFIGTGGMLANSRDMDPGSKDVGGATDRSIGGVATLGVLY